MKRLAGLLPLAFGVVLASGQTQAADYTASVAPLATWTGFYGAIGLGGEWGDFDFCIPKHHKKHKKYDLEIYTEVEEKDGKCEKKHDSPDLVKKTFKGWNHDPFTGGDDEGLFGTVQLGYNAEVMPHFVLGAFISADLGSNLDVSSDKHKDDLKEASSLIFLFPNDVWKASLGNIFTAGGRIGVAPSDKVFIYGLAGWSWADADISHSRDCVVEIWCHDFNNKSSDTVDGLTLGGGGEVRVSEHVSIGFEYRHTNFSSIDLKSGGGAMPALELVGDSHKNHGSADFTVDSVRGLVIYHF